MQGFQRQFQALLESAPDAIVIVRDPWKNLVRRAARDLRERRKPPLTILRRGWQLYGREPDIVAAAVAAGARPRSAARRLRCSSAASAVSSPRRRQAKHSLRT